MMRASIKVAWLLMTVERGGRRRFDRAQDRPRREFAALDALEIPERRGHEGVRGSPRGGVGVEDTGRPGAAAR